MVSTSERPDREKGRGERGWWQQSPVDLLKRIWERSPSAEADEIIPEWWEVVRANETHVRNICEEYGRKQLERLKKDAAGIGQPRRTRRQDDTAQVAIEFLQQKIREDALALLDRILPTTGKLVRDSTREELLQMGGWGVAIAERLGPGQTVGQAGITEAQLRELLEAAVT